MRFYPSFVEQSVLLCTCLFFIRSLPSTSRKLKQGDLTECVKYGIRLENALPLREIGGKSEINRCCCCYDVIINIRSPQCESIGIKKLVEIT